MRTYFFPSSDESYLIFTETPTLPMKNKLDKFCKYSEWNTDLLDRGLKIKLTDKLHGYIENGLCYDNQYIFYEQHEKKMLEDRDIIKKKLQNYIGRINKSIATLEDLYLKIRKYRDCKNLIIRMEETLKKGYVVNNQKVSGSKRQRRYKKNANLRYLTEQEIKNYKERIETESKNKIVHRQNIKPKKTIEDVFFTLGKPDDQIKEEARQLNFLTKDYGNTVSLFKIFVEVLEKFDKDIYNEVLESYKEVLRIDQEEKVQKNKTTKNKTRIYIDEDGVEHIIKEDVEQIIRTL